MVSTDVQDPIVIILADGSTPAAINNARGHLFETFIANFLHLLGYEKPVSTSLNVNTEGFELDVQLKHELDSIMAIAECKAYSSNIRSEMLAAFYGKLSTKRLIDPAVRGLFVAVPRLTADGHELASRIEAGDSSFKLITAVDLWKFLSDRQQIVLPDHDGQDVSDYALVVHNSGIYTAGLEIDSESKVATRVLVRAKTGKVNADVLRLLAAHSYSQSLVVEDAEETSKDHAKRPVANDHPIVEVGGSHSDFEYQLPASPGYFVGRKMDLRELGEKLQSGARTVVLNAKSGGGKSSFALKLASQIERDGGRAAVIDARTANEPSFVPFALKYAGESAQDAGFLELPDSVTWATLTSALRTLNGARWKTNNGKLLIFFDQFENAFRNEELTRAFRDLALLNDKADSRIVVGFAWKTDFVGWTEEYPYQLRDEIRGVAAVVSLAPLSASEVSTILNRLQKILEEKLSREMRQRLREYSQGLPWLLKKLCGHIIDEIRSGKTQEQLLSEGLNVSSLFDRDLAGLGPTETECLKFVARFAPVQASEVTEKFAPSIAQSLLNQRLVVQVGDKLDTYWDTFRDYLNTGQVPIRDSYILRVSPKSLSGLLHLTLLNGGSITVAEAAAHLNTSESVIWNRNRELRQLGLAKYEPHQVELIPEISQASEPEALVRYRVTAALKRHRAFEVFGELVERGQGKVTLERFAEQFKEIYPAVDVSSQTWRTYSRVFVSWLEYIGFVRFRDQTVFVLAEGSAGKGSLTSAAGHSGNRRARVAFPSTSSGPALELIKKIAVHSSISLKQLSRLEKRALQQLLALGAATMNGMLVNLKPGVFESGVINPATLMSLLGEVPGGAKALAILRENPAATQTDVGLCFQEAYTADGWASSTINTFGKSFRGWAKHAGVPIRRAPQQPRT